MSMVTNPAGNSEKVRASGAQEDSSIVRRPIPAHKNKVSNRLSFEPVNHLKNKAVESNDRPKIPPISFTPVLGREEVPLILRRPPRPSVSLPIPASLSVLVKLS